MKLKRRWGEGRREGERCRPPDKHARRRAGRAARRRAGMNGQRGSRTDEWTETDREGRGVRA
eukprot:6183046-Pleurochrysis_carterae.AAC.1